MNQGLEPSLIIYRQWKGSACGWFFVDPLTLIEPLNSQIIKAYLKVRQFDTPFLFKS